MPHASVRNALTGLLGVCLLLALAVSVAGCATDSTANTEGPAPEPAAEQPTPEQAKEPKEPAYTSWEVYINDHDTRVKGGLDYKVTLNLTATNPSATKAGTYTGKAVAQTETSGETGGHQLNASAIANSTQLEFTLEETDNVTDEDPLAPLTEEGKTYSGTGTIAMSASGSGSIDGAGGSFGKDSTENLRVKVDGSNVTLTVIISGLKYTFNGTISGK